VNRSLFFPRDLGLGSFSLGTAGRLSVVGALLDCSDMAICYSWMLLVLPLLIVSLVLDVFQYRSKDEFVFLKWSPMVKAACIAIVLLWIFIVTAGNFEQPFVYQAF